MSYTSFLLIYPKKEVIYYEEYKNAHGAAAFVWSALCNKYFGDEFAWLHNDKKSQNLWDLWKDTTLPEYERAVLMMTFDRMCIVKRDFQRAIDDITKFQVEYLKIYPDRVNHWNDIAMTIAKADFYTDAPAIGIYHMSVGDNPYTHWDDEKECEIINEHIWDMYAELDELNGNE